MNVYILSTFKHLPSQVWRVSLQ